MIRYNIDSELTLKCGSEDFIYQPIIHIINSCIDQQLTEKLIKSIGQAHQTGQKCLPVLIESYGGAVYTLLSMIDLLQESDLEIITIATGKAMSAAAVLLSCGTRRYIAPNTTIMIHQVSSISQGKNVDLQNDAQETERLNDLIFGILDSNCGQERGFFRNLVQHNKYADLFIDAHKCVEYGLAHHVRIPKMVANIKVDFSVE